MGDGGEHRLENARLVEAGEWIGDHETEPTGEVNDRSHVNCFEESRGNGSSDESSSGESRSGQVHYLGYALWVNDCGTSILG